METRVACITIIVENAESVEKMNALLHDYARYIIGRIFDGVDEASLNATIQTIMKMERNLSAL